MPLDPPSHRLLLLSNSKNADEPFLDHAERWTISLLQDAESILLIAYACPPTSSAPDLAMKFFSSLGLTTAFADDSPAAADQVDAADAYFLLGGNTFRLLRHLYDNGLLDPLRAAATAGKPLMGASAGTNVVCPTIATTNDMAIVHVPALQALGLVDFQINTHFVDVEYVGTFTGETRIQRVREYVREQQAGVLGIPEGTGVQVQGAEHVLLGNQPARAFTNDGEMLDVPPGPLAPELLRRLTPKG